jgi:hypothetical protein
VTLPLGAVLAASIAVALAAPGAHAADADASATSAYLQADYDLVRAGTSKTRQVESTLRGVLSRVRRECPNAAEHSPQNAQSTELSNEVIGAMVTAVVHLDLPAGRAFVKRVVRLRWSSRSLTRQVHEYAGDVRTLIGLGEPNVCADVRAWVAGGYATLPATTIAFAPRFIAAWVRLGDLPSALARSAPSSERGLVRKITQMEWKFTDLESREVETWAAIMNVLGLSP